MTSGGGFASDADRAFLQGAVDLATANVADGGGPFGAIVVDAMGTVIGEGVNRVTRDLDPSAHGEVVAIRAACQTVGDFALAGATLYTSCEPCPMCLTTALWARIDRVFYAADRDDAARGGFDDREFYDLFTRDRATWDVYIQPLRLATAEQPFQAWLKNVDRTDY
jgi:guanine deaminase